MKNRPNRKGRLRCCACCRAYSLLYPDIRELRIAQQNILDYLCEKQEAEPQYLTARQAMDRIGISESTLLRCQRQGAITVAKIKNRKKYFRERDVERLRREYWGL